MPAKKYVVKLTPEEREYLLDLTSKGEHHLVIGSARFLQNIAGYYFNGALDELVIFNTALTEDDIQALMSSVMTPVSPSGKLAAIWGDIRTR